MCLAQPVHQCRGINAVDRIMLSLLFGPLSRVFPLLHHFRIARPLDAAFFGLLECFRVQVVAALAVHLFDLYANTILVCPPVLTDAGHLPRDFYIRGAGSDDETIAFDLFTDDGLSESADYRELIAEVSVQRLEVRGQFDRRFAACISDNVCSSNVSAKEEHTSTAINPCKC